MVSWEIKFCQAFKFILLFACWTDQTFDSIYLSCSSSFGLHDKADEMGEIFAWEILWNPTNSNYLGLNCDGITAIQKSPTKNEPNKHRHQHVNQRNNERISYPTASTVSSIFWSLWFQQLREDPITKWENRHIWEGKLVFSVIQYIDF